MLLFKGFESVTDGEKRDIVLKIYKYTKYSGCEMKMQWRRNKHKKK